MIAAQERVDAGGLGFGVLYIGPRTKPYKSRTPTRLQTERLAARSAFSGCVVDSAWRDLVVQGRRAISSRWKRANYIHLCLVNNSIKNQTAEKELEKTHILCIRNNPV